MDASEYTGEYTEEQINDALMAVIAWAGNCTAAHRDLEASGKRVPAIETLRRWTRHAHAARYIELQEKYREQLEGQLENEYLGVAREATEGVREGVARAREQLEKNADRDPSRTAANLATVADKMTRDSLTLQGRPTSIREDRNVEEIIRSLVAKKVLALPEGEAEEPPA